MCFSIQYRHMNGKEDRLVNFRSHIELYGLCRLQSSKKQNTVTQNILEIKDSKHVTWLLLFLFWTLFMHFAFCRQDLSHRPWLAVFSQGQKGWTDFKLNRFLGKNDVGDFFPRLQAFWGEYSTIHSLPTVFLSFFFFFFEVEISLRTLIPLFFLCQDQPKVAQRAEMTVVKCSLMSCMWARFLIGSHTMPTIQHENAEHYK